MSIQCSRQVTSKVEIRAITPRALPQGSQSMVQEREAIKEENATPNSTKCGGVWDLVVAGCNHGDLATKRKGIQPQIFLVKERD